LNGHESAAVFKEIKLVRFAHPPEAENTGMVESWNDGFKEASIQNACDFIDCLVFFLYVPH